MDLQTAKSIIISWSFDNNYDDARKEWTVLRRASEDSKCQLCTRQLEYPVYIKNLHTGKIKIVGSGCCKKYITDVDSPDPDKSFARRLAEGEDKHRYKQDLDKAETEVNNFFCPLTSKLPLITNDCTNCKDEFIKRICEQFFLYPEVNLAKIRRYSLSDTKFLQIQRRIQIRALEEFTRMAREINKDCPVLNDPQKNSCSDCILTDCNDKEWAEKLIPSKIYFLKLYGTEPYIETLKGLFLGQAISAESLVSLHQATKETIISFKCPVTGLFPNSKKCNQDECTVSIKKECSKAEAYLEAFKQSGGVHCREVSEDFLACQAKEELINRISETFSPRCALITDPSMPLGECLKYYCAAIIEDNATCPFSDKYKKYGLILDNDYEKDALDQYDQEIKRAKKSFHLFRKVAYPLLGADDYLDLLEVKAREIGDLRPLANRIPRDKKDLAQKIIKRRAAAQEHGEKELLLTAKANLQALRKVAGLRHFGDEKIAGVYWEEWVDWNEGITILDVAAMLKEAGMSQELIREAEDLQEIIRNFGNAPNMIAAWVKYHHIEDYVWPLTPWTFPLKRAGAVDNKALNAIKSLPTVTLSRFFRLTLNPTAAQSIIDIDKMIMEPVTTESLVDQLLNNHSSSNLSQTIYPYLLKYSGLPIKEHVSQYVSVPNKGDWDEIQSFTGLKLLWNGYGHIPASRYLNTCNRIELTKFASTLRSLLLECASNLNQTSLRPYHDTCKRLSIIPKDLDKKSVCFQTKSPDISLDDIKKAAEKAPPGYKLGPFLSEIKLIQRLDELSISGAMAFDMWAAVGDAKQDYTKLFRVLGMDERQPFYSVKSEHFTETDLLNIACRHTGQLKTIALILRRFRRKAISIIEIDQALGDKNLGPISKILIKESVYAALEAQTDIDSFSLKKLIRHRKVQLTGGINYLATHLDQNIKMQQLVALVDSYGDRKQRHFAR